MFILNLLYLLYIIYIFILLLLLFFERKEASTSEVITLVLYVALYVLHLEKKLKNTSFNI